MSIELPLSWRQSPFGLIVDPKILLEARTLRGYRGYRFLVDTGADLSVVPRRLAQQVGHDWDTLPELMATGIGHGTVPAKLGLLPIRLGPIELSVPCLFMNQRITPFILGRAGILDRFALTIDAGTKKLVFTKIA